MKKIISTLTILVSLLVFFSCASVQNIPENYTAAQIIQLGQNAVDIQNYRSALAYFNAAIERFPEDSDVYVEARYEIGHTYYKQKKYDSAKKVYQELLDFYASNSDSSIPQSYKKLSQIGLDKINSK